MFCMCRCVCVFVCVVCGYVLCLYCVCVFVCSMCMLVCVFEVPMGRELLDVLFNFVYVFCEWLGLYGLCVCLVEYVFVCVMYMCYVYVHVC